MANKVLSNFGKGITESRAGNFSRSASDNCDKKCRWFNNGCYAERLEAFRPSLANKLERHELAAPTELVESMQVEMMAETEPVYWFRFSSQGSVPKAKVTRTKRYRAAFRNFCKYLHDRLGKRRIHLPVESHSKAKAYREIVGPYAVVRESLQTTDRLRDLRGPCSIVVGSKGMSRLDKELDSYRLADSMRAEGHTAVVCPAVVGDSKCGKCTACADERVELVVYPLH